MGSVITRNRISIANMVLIAGNGRNVGKTTLACKIISHLSQKHQVTGVKISPHFHSYIGGNIRIETESFIIFDERRHTTKDSSLMLQAGAKKVYFIMVKQEALEDALNALFPFLADGPVVCESGGLHEFADPGLFFFVNTRDREIEKPQLLRYNPIRVENDGRTFSLNIEKLNFSENLIFYNE